MNSWQHRYFDEHFYLSSFNKIPAFYFCLVNWQNSRWARWNTYYISYKTRLFVEGFPWTLISKVVLKNLVLKEALVKRAHNLINMHFRFFNPVGFLIRAVPGKTASGWNWIQLKFGGWRVFPGISIWTVP